MTVRNATTYLSRAAVTLPPMNSIELVRTLLSEGIQVGEPVSAGRLTLFLLIHGLPPGDHLLYQDAHTRGLVRIEETSESGTVGELKVTNLGTQPVLLLEGEVLLGMKQTRVLNISILVPGLAILAVPVSCVEMSRWHRVSDAALGKDRLNLSPRVRRAKTGSVMRSARMTGRYASDQSAVWDGVAEVIAEHDVSAPTGTYAELARQKADDILGRVRDLRPVEGQAGVLACAGSSPLCLDLFDGPSTLTAVWNGLVGSYLTDASATTKPARTTSGTAARWLRQLAAGDLTSTPSVGLGEVITCIGAKETSQLSSTKASCSTWPPSPEPPREPGQPSCRLRGGGDDRLVSGR